MNERAFVILGAGGGIGSATARVLAGQGARLMLAGRTPGPLEALAAETGGIAYPLDATRTAEVAAAVEWAVTEFGRVDGIANCVGSLLLKPAHITTDDEWDETISTNLRSAFAAVRAGARAMRADGGSIVLVSSAAAQIGLANHEAIAAAKGGISGLTLAAAASYASSGIRAGSGWVRVSRNALQHLQLHARGRRRPHAVGARLVRRHGHLCRFHQGRGTFARLSVESQCHRHRHLGRQRLGGAAVRAGP